MKVLLGVPQYPTEPHIYPATQASIDALEAAWDGHLDIGYYVDDDPKLSMRENLVAKHNAMRQMVLSHDHDALLMVEADMIIPPDALTKLAALEADVAYSLYCSRHSGMWLCFPTVGDKAAALNANPAQAKALWGQVITSEGAGFGCTLIRRRVLEAIEFRVDKRRKQHDDWLFALDAKAAGFTSKHDLSVVCGHIIHAGGVMWPDPDAPDLRRIEGQEIARFQGMELPATATYRVLRRLCGPTREYFRNDTIVLTADAAAIHLARRDIEMIQEQEQ